MKKMVFLLRFIICCYFVIVLVDVKQSFSHEELNGPYFVKKAKIISYDAQCLRIGHSVGRTAGGAKYDIIYNFEILLDGKEIKSNSPFIGMYPFAWCVFGKYTPFYNYQFLTNINSGIDVDVLIDRHGMPYLGRTNPVFNYVILCVLMALFFLVKVMFLGMKNHEQKLNT